MIGKALELARMAHAGQVRKYTGEPYIVHPCAVAGLVSGVMEHDAVIAAAFLHDVVEDTAVTLFQIEQALGVEVAELVRQVTDVSRPQDGNRAERKALDLDHLSRATPHAQTIKCADIIDNARAIVIFDPKFAGRYLEEKRRQLQILRDGNAELRRIAWGLVGEKTASPQSQVGA